MQDELGRWYLVDWWVSPVMWFTYLASDMITIAMGMIICERAGRVKGVDPDRVYTWIRVSQKVPRFRRSTGGSCIPASQRNRTRGGSEFVPFWIRTFQPLFA